MALKTITGKIAGPDGANKAARITATLSQPTTIAGTQETVPSIVTTTAAADGTYTLTLQANNDMLPISTYYQVTESAPDGGYYSFAIVVPVTAGPFVMSNILAQAPTLGASPSHISTLTVDGNPTGVAINAAGDVAGRSFTALTGAGPYISNLPGTGGAQQLTATPTPAGVLTGKSWDFGGATFSPMAFGAKFDGTTDDTTAITAACTAAIAVNNPSGGIVLLPPGVTVISKALPLAGQPNYNLIGAGMGETTIKLASNFDWTTVSNNAGAITANGSSLVVGGFTLDGALATSGSIGSNKYGMAFKAGASNFYFDIMVKSIGLTQADNAYAIGILHGQQNIFRNVNVLGNFRGAFLGGSGHNGMGSTFINCLWSNSSGGLNLELADYAGFSCTDNTFIGCILDELVGGETASGAITTSGCTRNTFIGGRLAAGSGGAYAFDIRAGTKTRFLSVYFGPWTTGLTTSNGLKVASGSDAYVAGCDLRNSATQGGSGGNGLNNAGTVYDGGGNTVDAPTGAGLWVTGKQPPGSTGAGSALLGSNSPAITVSAPFTWLKMIASDGSTVYVPAWK